MAMKPWHPIDNKVDLKHLGKLAEELGELSSAVGRCIIQGMEGRNPSTDKPNREWLEEEIADVLCCITLTIEHFKLEMDIINERCSAKSELQRGWHREA